MDGCSTIISHGKGKLYRVGPLPSKTIKKCVPDVVKLLTKRPLITIMGRPCRQQRNVGFFSDVCKGYMYSGRMMPSLPMSANLLALLQEVNQSVV